MKQKEQKLLTRNGDKEAITLYILGNAKEMQNQIWKLSCFQYLLWIFFFVIKKMFYPETKAKTRQGLHTLKAREDSFGKKNGKPTYVWEGYLRHSEASII